MKIRAADYARGLMQWKPIAGLTARVGTSNKAGEPVVWSEPLTNPEGSMISLDIGETIQFRYDMSGTDPIVRAEFWASIESVNKGAVIARVFHGMPPAPPVVLRHIPGYGYFHRVVVDARTLDWTHDVVFREMGILVRMVTGEVEGERMGNLKGGVDEQGKPVLTGEQGTTSAKGRFIEVVTPGKTAQQAEQHAYATLGLLALTLGDNVLGTVIFSEPWETSPRYQRGEAVALMRATDALPSLACGFVLSPSGCPNVPSTTIGFASTTLRISASRSARADSGRCAARRTYRGWPHPRALPRSPHFCDRRPVALRVTPCCVELRHHESTRNTSQIGAPERSKTDLATLS